MLPGAVEGADIPGPGRFLSPWAFLVDLLGTGEGSGREVWGRGRRCVSLGGDPASFVSGPGRGAGQWAWQGVSRHPPLSLVPGKVPPARVFLGVAQVQRLPWRGRPPPSSRACRSRGSQAKPSHVPPAASRLLCGMRPPGRQRSPLDEATALQESSWPTAGLRADSHPRRDPDPIPPACF